MYEKTLSAVAREIHSGHAALYSTWRIMCGRTTLWESLVRGRVIYSGTLNSKIIHGSKKQTKEADSI